MSEASWVYYNASFDQPRVITYTALPFSLGSTGTWQT